MAFKKFPAQIIVDSDYTVWDNEEEAGECAVKGPVAIYKLIATGKVKTVFIKDGGTKGE